MEIMLNKYSLNAESYGISKVMWREIKERVISLKLSSNKVQDYYELDSKQVWFLYDKLLQEKYNHLYKREKLVNPKVGDYVYCDYEGFGRGTIELMFSDNLMLVRFDDRGLPTMCNSDSMVTVHDEVKRKITRL